MALFVACTALWQLNAVCDPGVFNDMVYLCIMTRPLVMLQQYRLQVLTGRMTSKTSTANLPRHATSLEPHVHNMLSQELSTRKPLQFAVLVIVLELPVDDITL